MHGRGRVVGDSTLHTRVPPMPLFGRGGEERCEFKTNAASVVGSRSVEVVARQRADRHCAAEQDETQLQSLLQSQGSDGGATALQGVRESQKDPQGARESRVRAAATERHADSNSRVCPTSCRRSGVTLQFDTVGRWTSTDSQFMDHFCLPTGWHKNDQLSTLHKHPRDIRVAFFEESHHYEVDGLVVPISVTALVHACATPFDADAAIRKMKASANWPMKRLDFVVDGTELSDEEIKQKWKINGTVQAARGTLMHWQIERFMNGDEIGLPHSPEFQQFLRFHEEWFYQGGLKPYRTEWSLFHCGLGLAGQVDLAAVDANGDLVILDWKRCRNLKKDNPFQCMTAPLAHLPDCNYSHYCLQLNMYRFILETEYGFQVAEMHIVVFHPNQTSFQTAQIPRMGEEIDALALLAKSKGAGDPLPGDSTPFEVFPALTELKHALQ